MNRGCRLPVTGCRGEMLLATGNFFMLSDTKLTPPARNDVRTYKGIAASPGIAIGRAVIIERREASVFRVPIPDKEVPSEVSRFNEALQKTRDELAELKQKVSRSMGDEYASIFEAH